MSAKAIIATLTIAGAATAGSADIVMALTLVPAFMKAIADTGVYGALTINAAICFAVDGGFVVGEASYDTPVSAIVSVVGYPCLFRLEK